MPLLPLGPPRPPPPAVSPARHSTKNESGENPSKSHRHAKTRNQNRIHQNEATNYKSKFILHVKGQARADHRFPDRRRTDPLQISGGAKSRPCEHTRITSVQKVVHDRRNCPQAVEAACDTARTAPTSRLADAACYAKGDATVLRYSRSAAAACDAGREMSNRF